MSDTAGERESKKARAASVERQLNDEPPPEEPPENDPAPNPAEDADDVGESRQRRGEEVVDADGKEPGRIDTGTEGPTERPTGESTERDITGIDP